jgi:3-hydroxyacyl-CoA dehydrogenase
LKVEEIESIGVIGAGLMGHGIAQTFALKRYKALLRITEVIKGLNREDQQ